MAELTCTACGHVNKPGRVRCSRCDSVLPIQASAAPPPPPPAPPPAPPPPSAPPVDVTNDPFAEDAHVRFEVVLPSGRSIPLDPSSRLRLGRGQDSPLATECPDNVSRHHAEIIVRAERVVIVDLGSTNGTFVNGMRLQPTVEHSLHDGDVVQLAADPPFTITVRRT